MSQITIGELEELVLLAVGALHDKEAYAVEILNLITEEAGRNPDVTAIHAVLRRLEQKGLVNSVMGGATTSRGGRRKRFFSLTAAGRNILEEVMAARTRLYNKLPRLTFSPS